MNWTALSAIGTVLAAFVGITGIWLNLRDKKRRLKVNFESVPRICVYVSNPSLRTVVVTKMVCMAGNHAFYVEVFDGLQEVLLVPSSVRRIAVRGKGVFDEYYRLQIDLLCNPNEEIIIVLHDNYGRKYRIKTGLGIAGFNR